MFKGKTALITGANGGIGKSIVSLFLKNNATVVCLIRKSDQKFKKHILALLPKKKPVSGHNISCNLRN